MASTGGEGPMRSVDISVLPIGTTFAVPRGTFGKGAVILPEVTSVSVPEEEHENGTEDLDSLLGAGPVETHQRGAPLAAPAEFPFRKRPDVGTIFVVAAGTFGPPTSLPVFPAQSQDPTAGGLAGMEPFVVSKGTFGGSPGRRGLEAVDPQAMTMPAAQTFMGPPQQQAPTPGMAPAALPPSSATERHITRAEMLANGLLMEVPYQEGPVAQPPVPPMSPMAAPVMMAPGSVPTGMAVAPMPIAEPVAMPPSPGPGEVGAVPTGLAFQPPAAMSPGPRLGEAGAIPTGLAVQPPAGPLAMPMVESAAVPLYQGSIPTGIAVAPAAAPQFPASVATGTAMAPPSMGSVMARGPAPDAALTTILPPPRTSVSTLSGYAAPPQVIRHEPVYIDDASSGIPASAMFARMVQQQEVVISREDYNTSEHQRTIPTQNVAFGTQPAMPMTMQMEHAALGTNAMTLGTNSAMSHH